MKPGTPCEWERALSLPAQSDELPVLVARQLSNTRTQCDRRGAVRADHHDHSTVAWARPGASESGGKMRKRFQSMGPVTQGCPGAHAAYAKHPDDARSEEHTSELQSRLHLVCRLLLE